MRVRAREPGSEFRRATSRAFVWTVVWTVVLAAPATAAAQDTAGQLWLNATLGWQPSARISTELDVEPKIQIAGDEPWRNLDITPSAEFAALSWLDLTAETALGRTHQFDGLNTWEFTPRVGFRLRFFKTALEGLYLSGRLRQRWSAALLTRLEQRNFWYSNGQPSAHSWRLRTRLELKAGLNQGDLSANRLLYASADGEMFFPVDGDISETYKSKQRVRAGLGYRFDRKWRGEALYIYDRSRNSYEDDLQATSHMLDLRVKILF